MRALSLTLEAIASHESTEGKVQCAAAYLAGRHAGKVAGAARCVAGSPLPPGTPATKVGRATLVDLVAAFTGEERSRLVSLATRRGDLGVAIQELLAARAAVRPGPRLLLEEVCDALEVLGSASPRQRSASLGRMLERATPLEAKYLTKLLLGSLRTGMQAARVEEAIALAFECEAERIQRAYMLLGDIGTVAERAAAGSLEGVTLRAFRPVRSMLAHPVVAASEVVEVLAPPVFGEDKYDGIRTQLHLADGRVRLFSRTLEDVTHFFPELVDAPEDLEGEWILDGEVVAWLDGKCLPFSDLQRRLGRREVPFTLLLDAPVAYLAFDVLRASGVDLIDAPLSRRKHALERVPTEGSIRRLDWARLSTVGAIRDWYEAALRRGNEGAVFKDPDSRYRPGTRGRSWVKLKRPLGSLDVIVTAAEYGRGKRVGMLSDLTIAIRGDDGLLEIGKASSGLTDAEIEEISRRLKESTASRSDDVHVVEPTVVLEVTFNGIGRSSRNASGYALRFPRVVRYRPDLGLDDVDTMADVERLSGETRG